MHPAIQRFSASLGKKPYCSNNGTASSIRPRDNALKHDYVSLNRKRVAYLAFDIDYVGAAIAHESRGLPPPTLAIITPQTARGHLLYELDAPVIISEIARVSPIKYLADIEERMRDQLCADPGFAGLMIKNPLSARWNTVANDVRYDLRLLLEYLPDKKPRKTGTITGWGRNCSLFDKLRVWAYTRIASAKSAGYDAWLSACIHQAESFNQFDNPLSFTEVKSISKSVAKWTWSSYSGSTQAKRVRAAAERIALQNSISFEEVLLLLPGLVADLAGVPERTVRHLRKTNQV